MITMPEPVATAVIAAVGGLIGGVVSAIARPWGEDYVAREADKRAAQRVALDSHTAYVKRVGAILAGASVDGPKTAQAEREWRELPEAAAAVGDLALTTAVERMLNETRRSEEWSEAQTEASRRVGELLLHLG